ncbi:hypothetical protein L914_14306 [Phytophthora nicotianae]|uniref:Uncharacterized protein n=2 Tax=Phytophthora nicotianae TaxID=4792 RepID=V9EJW0_PHYNI|nr:hypothetical protein F443_14887 [Phytophthora nicotianae P1569]ETM39551.1 hypothetical protein L914_14306 [Phytophthora nicotianae]
MNQAYPDAAAGLERLGQAAGCHQEALVAAETPLGFRTIAMLAISVTDRFMDFIVRRRKHRGLYTSRSLVGCKAKLECSAPQMIWRLLQNGMSLFASFVTN